MGNLQESKGQNPMTMTVPSIIVPLSSDVGASISYRVPVLGKIILSGVLRMDYGILVASLAKVSHWIPGFITI